MLLRANQCDYGIEEGPNGLKRKLSCSGKSAVAGTLPGDSNMSFHIYALYPPCIDRIYIGRTGDLDTRIHDRKNGYSGDMARASDRIVIKSEEFETRS